MMSIQSTMKPIIWSKWKEFIVRSIDREIMTRGMYISLKEIVK